MKSLLLNKWLLSLTMLFCIPAYADETPPEKASPPPALATEVEFGYQAYSGNSDSDSLNARFRAEYIKGRYRSNGEWKYFRTYKDGVENKRLSTLQAQTDYKLSPKNYLYGNYKRTDSKYSAYFVNYTLSSGLGFLLSYTKQFSLELEFGPGFRYQEPNSSKIGDKDIIFPEDVEELIGRGNIKSTWQALENLSLSASVTLVAGKSNTQTDTDFSATNAITEHIALKLSHNSQYYDRVPEGLTKRDSIFSVNLLFRF